ncbi:hypothetical protein T492DRAFT_599846 [Pavlovales sp. CCMP2436]|nr:hypothetical protein T492DRAFT_599846 [Pavlovales sp. CCMP2436]
MTGSCVICLDDFEHDQRMRTLPCFHSFHSGCVEEWLVKHRTCPSCTFDIVAAGTEESRLVDETAAVL